MDIIDDYVEEPIEESVEDYVNSDSSDDNYVDIESVSNDQILYVVSDNGVSKDDFYILINEVRGLREDVQNKQYSFIYTGVPDQHVSDNEIVDIVSDNIIDKQLKDYNTSESIALIGLLLAFSALIIYLIHKTVFKIKR